MEFKDFVDKYKDDIYKKICEYVPLKEPMGHYQIMRDYIDRRGKYRRPGLLLLTAHLYGGTLKDALLPAAAQQLSEDWILMQDDIEDDSELRRGKPAAQKIYGWVNALNATNTGHIAMWKMLKDYILQVGSDKGNRLYNRFYDMLECTVEGQYIENTFIHYTKDLNKADEATYFKIVYAKTAYYTVFGPMVLGAIASGAKDSDLQMLKEIGEKTAYAFQIVDDILDLTADEKTFGKKNNGDLFEGKITIPVLHAYKNANREERERMNSTFAKQRKDKTNDEIMFIRSLMEKYKSIEYAQTMAERYGEEAHKLYDKYKNQLPNNEYRDVLLSAINELYIRNK